jgi:hypothetical protein
MHERIGVTQDVVAVNLVVEQIEVEGRLRLTIQLSLKVLDRYCKKMVSALWAFGVG